MKTASPTIADRVAQAAVKNALEPSWEARFEANSYGFRPGRSCHDALAQCHQRLQKGRDEWILTADIRGAFDHVSHEVILDALGNTPGRALIKQWLKAGYVEAEMFYNTPSGTPQGGIVSPLLLNIALTGLEDVLTTQRKVKAYVSTRPQGRHAISRKASPRYGYIRYADDMLVTASSKEDIDVIVPTIEQWLAERGLGLKKEKTTITHVKEGVNFLGFHIRQFQGSCYILPQKEKVHAFLADMRTWLQAHEGATPETVIRTLNPLLRGWGNYYKHSASKQTFKYIDHGVWQMLWRWARKRHPKKSKTWIAQKYFMPPHAARWTIHALVETRQGGKKPLTIVQLADIPIERHIKVAGTASPDDPTMSAYWTRRHTRYGKTYWGKGSKLRAIAEKQRWQCPICGEHLLNGEKLHTHHKIPVQQGGTDRTENLVHLHEACHQHLHQMGGVPALLKA
jgi:RNA-directed DNA polymerase